MRKRHCCALLAAGLMFALAFITPAQADETETIERLEQLEREQFERLEQLGEDASQREENGAGAEKRKRELVYPVPFGYTIIYGGYSEASSGDMVEIEDEEGEEIEAEIDFEERKGDDRYDPAPRFLAIAGGSGRSFYHAAVGNGEAYFEWRSFGEARYLRTTDEYKGMLNEKFVEAEIQSFALLAGIEALVHAPAGLIHLGLGTYLGVGLGISQVDVTYTSNDYETDSRGWDYNLIAGVRFYGAEPGSGGLVLDLRGEIIEPADDHWGGSIYYGVGLGWTY